MQPPLLIAGEGSLPRVDVTLTGRFAHDSGVGPRSDPTTEEPFRPEIDRSGRTTSESADMLPGSKLGPYEIIESIGRGGMGEVYRARDARLSRNVAIKTVASGALADPAMRERFDREARAVAALSHPNILAIYDVGDCDGIPYVAVELLEGDTLRPHLGTSPLPLSTALDYAVQIGRGLAAAHDRGIVHRDLKPENIFVTRDGQVKLLDFGLATEPAGELGDEPTRAARTEAGLVLGTAGYMSPEQARGEHADVRSDIFSFGCVLYEMLAARRAFASASRIETLHAVLKEHPPDLTSLRSDVSPSLNRVVRRCLEKAPEGRFQTARDLVFALENLAPGSEPTPAPSQVAPARRARGRAVVIVAAVALLAVGAAWWWTVLREPASREAASHVQVAEAPRLLAVLPFENISGSSEGYFAQGMTQEVTSQLSKLSALRVIGSTALAQFKDPRSQLSALAKELGIGSAVTGTVREQGARVRVNVELIDAQSGHVIWSEQYDREGVDVFAAQSDIAVQVGQALNASVTLEEQARIGKRPTSSVAAYELFVRARTAPGKTTEDSLRASIDLLNRAVAADPQFAEAYSEMANDYYFLGAYGDRSALARGVEAASSALKIDPELASGYRGLALNLNEMGRLHEALPAYLKAVTINPSYGSGLVDFAHGLMTAGRYDEALKYALRARQLNPNATSGGYHQGVALVQLDDDTRSERFLTAAAARAPSGMRLQILLALLDLRRGRPQAAIDRIRAAAEKTPDNIEVLLTRAEIGTFAAAPDAPDHVASLFERAAEGLFHTAPYPVKLAHAYHLHRRGASAGARKITDQILATNRRALADGADWPTVFMQNAAVYALQGHRPAALDELERAYAAGWRDWRTLAIDPFFTSVRSEPRFTQLLSRIESDVAAMRARADYSGLP
jgi:TolB-like protein/Tfp pilus assembly protein PilF